MEGGAVKQRDLRRRVKDAMPHEPDPPWPQRNAVPNMLRAPTLRRLALLLIAPWSLTAPATATATTAAATPAVQAHPALWVVKDHDTTIYLFGTIHLLKPGIDWFNGPVRKAFDASQELVLEIADQSDPALQARILQHAVDAKGPTLTSQLPEAIRPKFADLLNSYGAPMGFFDQMKPWFAALTLTALPLRKLGYDPASGVEPALRAAARAQDKPIIGLETTEEQMGYFEGLSQEMQISLLVQTIEEQSDLETTISQMIAAWSAGQPVKLAAVLNQSMDEDPALEQRLLFDRNQSWADWIKARMKKPGVVFLAVGAGHLAGKGSVQDALKARHIKARLVSVP